jgi:hypothetical protein
MSLPRIMTSSETMHTVLTRTLLKETTRMNTLLHDIHAARRQKELDRRLQAARESASKRINLLRVVKRLIGG